MKRILILLCVLVLFALALPSGCAETLPIIHDEADLLTEEEEAQLTEVMTPICRHCTPVFWTTNAVDDADILIKAGAFCNKLPDVDEYALFVIDMYTRHIAVYSTGVLYNTITTDVANEITEHTFQYATDGDYLGCARQAFLEIYDVVKAKIQKAISVGSDSGTVVLDLDSVQMYLNGEAHIEASAFTDGLYQLYIPVVIENRTNSNVMVRMEHASVNGWPLLLR